MGTGVACDVSWARANASPRLVAGLDPTEQARWSALRRPADRARFATGRALARSAVVARTGMAAASITFSTRCPRCGEQHGKPHLADSGVEFSLSHAGDLVVLAVTEGVALGVDVEQVAAATPNIAVEALTVSERRVFDAVAAVDQAAALATYWTRKEALLKATGEGLIAPMTVIAVSAPHELADVRSWAGRSPGDVRLVDLHPGAGYVAALAALTSRELVVSDHGRVDPLAPQAVVRTSPRRASLSRVGSRTRALEHEDHLGAEEATVDGGPDAGAAVPAPAAAPDGRPAAAPDAGTATPDSGAAAPDAGAAPPDSGAHSQADPTPPTSVDDRTIPARSEAEELADLFGPGDDDLATA